MIKNIYNISRLEFNELEFDQSDFVLLKRNKAAPKAFKNDKIALSMTTISWLFV